VFPDTLSAKVLFEMSQIEINFSTFQSLFNLVEKNEPNMIELAAISTIINSFYMGIERIMQLIAQNMDNELPHGENWHKKLLIQMSCSNKNRMPFISENLFEKLLKYLSFRHFQRNSYEYILDWPELKPLFLSLKDTFAQFKQEMSIFMSIR